LKVPIFERELIINNTSFLFQVRIYVKHKQESVTHSQSRNNDGLLHYIRHHKQQNINIKININIL